MIPQIIGSTYEKSLRARAEALQAMPLAVRLYGASNAVMDRLSSVRVSAGESPDSGVTR